MSQLSQNANQLVAVVQIEGGKLPLRHTMADGSSLTLGCDPQQCGLTLESPDVAPRHCVIHMSDGKVFVTDWYSDSGTFVNGEKIYTETLLRPMDQLTVGPFQIRYAMSTQSAADDVSFSDMAEPEVAETDTPGEQPMPDMSPEPNESMDSGPAGSGLAESLIADLDIPVAEVRDPDLSSEVAKPAPEPHKAEDSGQLQAAHQEIERLTRELEYQKALAAMNESAQSPYDSLGGDESELLRGEIEHLQTELSRRESEIQELLNSAPADDFAGNSGGGPDHDSERLVQRLDELLAELKASDERARNLETLLQASEDATHAEREERDQLSGWVSEIESRISDREHQWQVEQQKLESQLQDATDRFERAEKNVEQVVRLHADEYQQNVQQQVTELTQRNALLTGKLEQAKSAHAQLEKLVAEVGTSKEDLQEMAARQDELRQHEVEIAQERASITRQRAEIAQLRDELEQAASQAPSIENPDCRIRQFREHLREIHENDKRERQQRSLGGRISRLWKRVDDT